MTLHVSVLAQEIVEALQPGPGDFLIDGTCGGGGHTRLLAEQVQPNGLVLGVDRDPIAIENCENLLSGLPVKLVIGNFADIPEIVRDLELGLARGIVLDLGLSSDQLADNERGFSYMSDGPLDLRFNPQFGTPAWKLLERMSERHLADLIYKWGEERLSRRIARAIVARRREQPVRTAAQLSQLLQRVVPRSRNHSIHPATRTFQALRIAVNDELKWAEVAIRRLPDLLAPGGRIAVISFHSLEDRIAKNSFRENDKLKVITGKPIRASAEEIGRNPRSRSSRLRVAERLEGSE
jgi:16S rRNA (cytosine1402-N4)-methyltransferase